MKALEKIARDICWYSFSPQGRKGKTKAAYWKSISDRARGVYLEEAKQFVWLLHILPLNTVNGAHDLRGEVSHEG